MIDVPTYVKEGRLAAHLSQQELADRLGISRQHISLLERGERTPSLRLFSFIQHALGDEPVLNINVVHYTHDDPDGIRSDYSGYEWSAATAATP